MTRERIVGLDLVKGIAIFMMVIVHAITQVIADYDGRIFLSVLDKIPKFVAYIVIYPIAIIGLWGTTFTLVTAMTTSMSALRIMETNKKAMGMYLVQRLAFLILLRLSECVLLGIFDEKYDMFNNSQIVFPPITIGGAATTLDSIGWGGIIAPLLIWILYPLIQRGGKKFVIILFTILVFGFFALSPVDIRAFKFLSDWSYLHKMGLLGDIFGKISLGRFKIAHTISFVIAGSLFGYLIHTGESIKNQIRLGFVYFLLCVGIFIAWCVIDPSFFEHIADEDVPLPAQIVSLGCECFLIYVHVYFVDGDRDIQKKLKSRKRCIYLFRMGMLSLTIFCVGGWVGKQLSLPWQVFFGPPCLHDPPTLLWNPWVCILFAIFLALCWLGISILWEKVDFKGSLEHLLMWAMSRIVGKKYVPNNRKFVYGPVEELEEGKSCSRNSQL